MVKGISRQVIVMHSPDPKLFDQAIFILKDDAVKGGISDEALLGEAKRLIRSGALKGKPAMSVQSALWACAGAGVTGLAWLLSLLL